MKSFKILMAWSLVVYTSMFVGVAMADGVGACVAGNGASLTGTGTGTFTGVNVGDPTTENSQDGVYDTQEGYEAQCCAETGQEPDCFEPVG